MPQASRPNVILILADDMGYGDFGVFSDGVVNTPQLDRLVGEGTCFRQHYSASPICAPARAALLTGRYPPRTGAITQHEIHGLDRIALREVTIADAFRSAGYATSLVGKWHNGTFDRRYEPNARGFDEFTGFCGGWTDYYRYHLRRNDTSAPSDGTYLTDLLTDEALGFIERNRNNPFFLYLPHTMLHNPLGVSKEFKGSSNWGEYGDAIQELDYNVGRIFDSLKRLGIDDNTIVVYASDNGRGPGRTPQQKIRGRKLSTYEGGIRVPAIAWGPGLGLQAGKESPAVVRAMDWYPTLATFAGIKVPEGRVIDGRDISPLLKGETKVVPPPGMKKSLNASVPLRRRWDPPGEWKPLIHRNEYNDAFFYHGSQGALAAVRWRNWKLYLNPSLQLYDLGKDPGESKLARNREIIRKLRGMAILFQEEMRLDARPAGEAPPQPRTDGQNQAQRHQVKKP